MTKLDFDVARIFIQKGERIKPKRKSPSWHSTCHSSNGIHIGKYLLWCSYNPIRSIPTVVHVSSSEKIPFEIVNCIYEKFKDEEYHRPYFQYDDGGSFNPFIPIVPYELLSKAKHEIGIAIRNNPRVAYFFSEEAATRVNHPLFPGDPKGMDMCLAELSSEQFMKNMRKLEKRESIKVDSIILYSMEQLEFVLELLKADVNN